MIEVSTGRQINNRAATVLSASNTRDQAREPLEEVLWPKTRLLQSPKKNLYLQIVMDYVVSFAIRGDVHFSMIIASANHKAALLAADRDVPLVILFRSLFEWTVPGGNSVAGTGEMIKNYTSVLSAQGVFGLPC